MAENKHLVETDYKKRPLSIDSVSSSSTSSLPRRRKRQNVNEYAGSTTSSQLDIEKIDNILYIDDAEVPECSADELSICSDDKQKSGGDSDSQFSADQVEMLQHTIPAFHQSDASLSSLPSGSACSSKMDLESIDPRDDRFRRSPSRSSRSSGKSESMSRSSSQKGHYVSYVQRVVTELVETERIYVLHLQDIKEVILCFSLLDFDIGYNRLVLVLCSIIYVQFILPLYR